MTDQIELPPVPQSPPIVSLAGMAEAPTVLSFDGSKFNEMLVNLQVRDEDLTETLEVRWRIVTNDPPPGTPVMNFYGCPEPTIVGNGVELMRSKQFPIQSINFARGKCSRVDVIVSASFKMCRPDRDDWDITTLEDDESDIGRLSFFVWEISDNPMQQPAAAFALLASCPQAGYQPQNSAASATPAASLEQ